ncbi:MAG: hypothetical protein DF199_00760 [Lactobacillus delbrueckii subsp. lactis]|nr:MAG: hypothetical protein DF199_00760 [Lactobacillus delbrueckii subsp. lactis]
MKNCAQMFFSRTICRILKTILEFLFKNMSQMIILKCQKLKKVIILQKLTLGQLVQNLAARL